MENLEELEQHKIGTAPNDIRQIYAHVTKDKEGYDVYDTVYVTFNNGRIAKVNKPFKMKPEEFLMKFSEFLTKVGANNDNRDNIWHVVDENSPKKEELDDVEVMYQFHRKEEAEITNKRYRAMKVRVVRGLIESDAIDLKSIVINTLSTAVLALGFISACNHHNELAVGISGIATLTGAALLAMSSYKIIQVRNQLLKEERDKEAALNEIMNQDVQAQLEQQNQQAITEQQPIRK